MHFEGEKVLLGRRKRCSLERYKSSLKGKKCILEGKGFNGGGKYLKASSLKRKSSEEEVHF